MQIGDCDVMPFWDQNFHADVIDYSEFCVHNTPLLTNNSLLWMLASADCPIIILSIILLLCFLLDWGVSHFC